MPCSVRNGRDQSWAPAARKLTKPCARPANIWPLMPGVTRQGKVEFFMYGMRRDELRLLPHDPAWENDFLAEKRRIADHLGDPSARIEHVGSTAIPTVHAKPILDIAILCGGKGLAPLIQTLTGLGYEYRGQYGDEAGHHYAVRDSGDVRLCQAHIFTEADADWHAKLKFRDVLRRDRELAREYDEYKLGLAEVAADKTEYAEIKSRWVDTFILKVMSAAVDA